MSKEILILFKDEETIKKLQKELTEKYIDCHFKAIVNLVDLRRELTESTFDLAIVSHEILKTIELDFRCPVVLVNPNFSGEKREGIRVIESEEALFDWIKTIKVDPNDTVSSLRNLELVNNRKASKTSIDSPSKSYVENEESLTNKETQDSNGEEDITLNQPKNEEEHKPQDQEPKVPETSPEAKNSEPFAISEKNKATENRADNSQKVTLNKKPNELGELYYDAVDLVTQKGVASTNMIKDYFQISYGEASQLIDQMEMNQIISPFEAGKPREVLNQTGEKDVNKSEDLLPDIPLKEDVSFDKKAATFAQLAFGKNTLGSHKRIGVWSPQGGRGTTMFLINYAIYLAKNNYLVSVVEGISNRNSLKQYLKPYSGIPKNWESLATSLFRSIQKVQKEEDLKEKDLPFKWNYKDVDWFPIDDTDPTFPWNRNKILSYFDHFDKKYNIVFIDLPGGYLDKYSEYTIDGIDELWIIMDNNIIQMLEVKDYIEKIDGKKEGRGKIITKLICNHEYPWSKPKLYSRDMEIPLLASIPALSEELQRNLYESEPLIAKEEILEMLTPAFEKITKQLQAEKSLKGSLKKSIKRLVENSIIRRVISKN